MNTWVEKESKAQLRGISMEQLRCYQLMVERTND